MLSDPRDYVVLRQPLDPKGEEAETLEVFGNLGDAYYYLVKFVQPRLYPWLSITHRVGRYYDTDRELQMRVFIKRRRRETAYDTSEVERRNDGTQVRRRYGT